MDLISTFFTVTDDAYEVIRPQGSQGGVIIIRKETFNGLEPKMYLEPEIIELIIDLYQQPVEKIETLVPPKKKITKEKKVDPLKTRKKKKKKS